MSVEEWAQFCASLGLDLRVNRARLGELLEGTRSRGLRFPAPDATWAAGTVEGSEVAVAWERDVAHVVAPIDPPLLVGMYLRERNPADLTRVEPGRYVLRIDVPRTDALYATALHVDGAAALFASLGVPNPFSPLVALVARGDRFLLRDHAVRLVGGRTRAHTLVKDAARIALLFAARRMAAAGKAEWERAIAAAWRRVGDAFGLTFDVARMRLDGQKRQSPLSVRLRTEHLTYVTEIEAVFARASRELVCVPRPHPSGQAFLDRFSTHAPGAPPGAWPPEEAKQKLLRLLEAGDRPEIRFGRLRVYVEAALGSSEPLSARLADALSILEAIEGPKGLPYR